MLDASRRQLLKRVASSIDRLTSAGAISAACQEGRVVALLVRPDHLSWGPAGTAEEHAQRLLGDIDLVSAAISDALAQGATIYPAWPGELPPGVTIEVVQRY